MVPISVVLQSVLERLGELTAAGGETMPGLTTGFSDVDRKINGLNKSDLLLLAGRPGMGKTSMGLNVAVNAAKASQKTVAVFSLEMSREQLVTGSWPGRASSTIPSGYRQPAGERLGPHCRGRVYPQPAGHPHRR